MNYEPRSPATKQPGSIFGGNMKYAARVVLYVFVDADTADKATDTIFEEIESSGLEIDGDITVFDPVEVE